MTSFPSAARRSSSGSLAYAISPSHCSSCSSPQLAASVSAPRVTACGAADGVWIASGRPARSAMAMILVRAPSGSPRLVVPTLAPLFWQLGTPSVKVPSMQHAARSSLPQSDRSSARTYRRGPKTPLWTSRWKRRWHVWYDGSRSGRSCQRALLPTIARAHGVGCARAGGSRRTHPARAPSGQSVGVRRETALAVASTVRVGAQLRSRPPVGRRRQQLCSAAAWT